MLGQDPSVGSGHNAQKSTASVSPAPSALVDDGPATAADDGADEYALAGPYTIDPTSWQYLMWKDGLILSAILSIVTLPMLLAFVVKVPGARPQRDDRGRRSARWRSRSTSSSGSTSS